METPQPVHRGVCGDRNYSFFRSFPDKSGVSGLHGWAWEADSQARRIGPAGLRQGLGRDGWSCGTHTTMLVRRYSRPQWVVVSGRGIAGVGTPFTGRRGAGRPRRLLAAAGLRKDLKTRGVFLDCLSTLPFHPHPNPPPSRERGFVTHPLILQSQIVVKMLESALVVATAVYEFLLRPAVGCNRPLRRRRTRRTMTSQSARKQEERLWPQ